MPIALSAPRTMVWRQLALSELKTNTVIHKLMGVLVFLSLLGLTRHPIILREGIFGPR